MNTKVMDIVLKLGILIFVVLYIFNVYNMIKMNKESAIRDKYMNEQFAKMHREVIDSLSHNIEVLKNQVRYRDTLIFNNNIEKTNIIHEMDAQITRVSSPSYTKDSIRMFFANNY